MGYVIIKTSMKHSRPVISYKSFVISRNAFTVLELLIFSAIFALVMVSFITILITVLRVQSRQSAAAQVNEESQFLLQQIQRYVQISSLVDDKIYGMFIPQDLATSTLKLRMAASSADPTYIYASGTVVYLKQTDGGTPQPLTTGRVSVGGLSFTRHSNAPSHDSVSVSFTVAYNTSVVAQQFSEALQTAIARVNAATFDSNVIPSSTAGTYSLGTNTQYWNSVNQVINFSGSNVYFTGTVGVNMGQIPTSPVILQVAGGDVYIASSTSGVIFKNGTSCWRFYLTSNGMFATSSVSCT